MKENTKCLNGVKGLLCLVIAFGAHMRFPDTPIGNYLSTKSWIYTRSVEVFCAISGFGISAGYFNTIKTMDFLTYIKRRISKIFPLYWLTLTICLLIQLIGFKLYNGTFLNDYSLDLYHTIFAYLGIECGWIIGASPVNGPLWTINCLILCYILYYAIVRFSKNRSIYISSLFILLFISLTGIFKEWVYPFLNWDNTLRCLGSFCIGALIQEIYTNKKWSVRILLFEYISLGYLAILRFIYKIPLYDAMGNRASIVVIVFCPIIILSAIYIKPLKYILESKACQWLGSISMSLYMWNWVFVLIANIIFPQFTNNWLYIAIYVCVHLISVALIHKYIEPKILPYIQKLIID